MCSPQQSTTSIAHADGDANTGIAFACSHQQTPLELSPRLQNIGPQLSPCLEHPAAETRLSGVRKFERTPWALS